VRPAARAAPRVAGAPVPEAAADATVSVIIAILRDEGPALAALHRAYREALSGESRPIEFIYVLGWRADGAVAALRALKDEGEALELIVLSRWDGEGAALRSAFQRARGDTVLILPCARQVDPCDVPKVLDGLADHDLVVARRAKLRASWFDAAQARLFQWLIRTLFGRTIADPVCRVRACRRQVLEEIAGYSVQQHFLPLLAAERGFRIAEVEVREGGATDDGGRGFASLLLSRLRLALEAASLFLVLKFIHKPLRFFGTAGLPILLIGLVYTGILGFNRLFFGTPLADRPALILGVLLIVLGIQVIALGLIGEIIIYAAGKRIKDYTIEKIL
jgi:glycosyltransferase involved in cell wall biosynthesis